MQGTKTSRFKNLKSMTVGGEQDAACGGCHFHIKNLFSKLVYS